MAITVDVISQLDEEELAATAARIRTTVREAVQAGIQDALNDLRYGQELRERAERGRQCVADLDARSAAAMDSRGYDKL